MGDDGPIADHDDRGKLPDKSHEARKGKPAAPHDGSGLDHVLGLLTSRITGIGAVLAALVVLNNAITSLTDEVLQRSKAFRERAAAEETFWTGMFTQFLDAAAVGDKDQRNKKFEVIRDMVKLKEIPNFKEFGLGLFRNDDEPKNAEIAYLTGMKSSLEGMLAKNPVAGEALANATFTDAASVDVRTAAQRAQDTVTQQAKPADADLNYDTQILASGSQGIDIDVFWCISGNPGSNYNRAMAGASALAEISKKQSRLGNDQVGRVRLRALPADKEKEYSISGPIVRFDKGPEDLVAEAAAQKMTALTSVVFRTDPVNVNHTPNYLSVFACKAPPA